MGAPVFFHGMPKARWTYRIYRPGHDVFAVRWRAAWGTMAPRHDRDRTRQ